MKQVAMGLIFVSMIALAQSVTFKGQLAYIKDTSVVVENLTSNKTQIIANTSAARWIGFTGSRILIWRDAGIFMSVSPFVTATQLAIEARNLEGINNIGEKLFLAYRLPSSATLSYQIFNLESGRMQPSAFFPETGSADASVLAYRIDTRVRVLKGSNAFTGFEYPKTETLNWGISPPALIPDGKTLLLAHNNGTGFSSDGLTKWDLTAINLETKKSRRIISRNARIPDGVITSPDGTRALISYFNKDRNTLEIVNVAQGFARVIHQNFVEGVAGSWSPDGQYILAENIAANNSDIFIKDSTGQTLKTILGAHWAIWLP